MKRVEQGQRVRIYIGEGDQWHGKLLYAAIVQEPRLFAGSGQLPVVVEIVDTAERIAAFLPCLDEMVQEGLVTTSEVSIVRYSKG